MTIFRGSVFRESVFRGSVFNGGVFFNPGHYTFCSYTTNADSQDGTIKLSLPAGKSITIHWGDGNTTDITGAVSYVEYTNTYAVTGTYDITVTGDYNDISYLKSMGTGEYSGDVKYIPNNLLVFLCFAANTFFGDIANLPISLQYVTINGYNTITGDISTAPAGKYSIDIRGHNTVFGDFANTPVTLTSLGLAGWNTLAGVFSNKPANLKYCYLIGGNTISGYSAPTTWIENQARITVNPVSPGGLSTSEVDTLLHDLAQVTTWSGEKVVSLLGTNEPRSSASDADVTTLTNLGVTVTTNVYTFCSYTTNADSQDGTIKLSLPADKKITIHWGDGNTTEITGAVTTIEYTNTYAVTGTYDITVTGDYNDISYLKFTGSGNWSGDVKYLPNNLFEFFSLTTNTFSGDIANLPATLTRVYVSGSNTITGNLANLPSGLTALYVYGNNTITGDIVNLPVSLQYCYVYGNNTVTGDLADIPASILTFNINGDNIIYGDLADLPANIVSLKLYGLNVISGYTSPRTWAENQDRISIIPVSPGGLSTSEVDALLHDLAQVTTWTGNKGITLTGTNSPRSSASDADVTTLTNLGVTVTTNT